MSLMMGLVLAGGAARGAYEVGVLAHLARLGRARFDILSGTSVGALHACALAALAEDPARAVGRLLDTWREMRLADTVRIDARSVAGMALALLGLRPRGRGGVLSNAPFVDLLYRRLDFGAIATQLRAGRLAAVTVSATHVATGRTVVFVESAAPLPVPPARAHAGTVLVATRLEPPHALASAAVPLLFPAVTIDGELYCDGGLRQVVPLAPALRLGADALLVVSPHAAGVDESPAARRARERAVGSPVYLAGKTLDALLVGHVDEDLERLEHTNALLRAGQRRYGADFVAEIDRELRRGGGHDVRPVRAAVVRPSRDIGALAADFVRSPRFARRACTPAAWLLRRLADADGSRETDLLSYLLFDGAFADALIELGAADARAHEDELVALFGPDATRAAG